MVNLNLPDNSKIMPGKTHGVDGPNKITFNIYRWNREDNKNPRVDKYFVDKKKLGPMTLDALMFIKNDIGSISKCSNSYPDIMLSHPHQSVAPWCNIHP